MKILYPFLFAVLFTSTCHAQSYAVYVSDAGNFNNPPWQILKYDENGQNPEVFINSNLAWPQDILFLEDSNVVLISNLNSGTINRHNATTGDYLNNFASGISGPTRIKIGPDTLLYALQWSGNGKVLRYELDGTFVDEFTSIGVPQSIGLDWDSLGNLYVSSYNTDVVQKFDPNGNDLGVFVSSNLVGPTNIWFDENGDLLVADYNGTAVKRFDSNGNYVNDFLSGLSQSEGVAYLPNGDILIGNGNTSSVKRFDSSGNPLPDFVSSGSGGLLTPNAVVVRTIQNAALEKQAIDELIIAPTHGDVFSIEGKGNYEMSVVNLAGQLIYHCQFVDQFSFDARRFSQGMYLLTVQNESGGFRQQKVWVEHE